MGFWRMSCIYAIDPVLEPEERLGEYVDESQTVEEGHTSEHEGGALGEQQLPAHEHDCHADTMHAKALGLSMPEMGTDPGEHQETADDASEYTYAEPGLSAVTANLHLEDEAHHMVHASKAMVAANTQVDGGEALSEVGSESSADDELSIPDRWSFRDFVDSPLWGDEINSKVSLLADMVFPRA